MISHGTNVSNIYGTSEMILFRGDERYLSFLPLAHIFERAVHNFVIRAGGQYGLTSNGVRNLNEDMAVLHPTLLCMVPRVANRFYDNIQLKLRNSSIIKRGIFLGMFFFEVILFIKRYSFLSFRLIGIQ